MQERSGDVARIRVKTLFEFRDFGPVPHGEARLIQHRIAILSARRSSHANLELPRVGELVGPREAHR